MSVPGPTKPFVRPKKSGFKNVIGAGTPESSLPTHASTRARDLASLERIQRERPLKPPSKQK